MIQAGSARQRACRNDCKAFESLLISRTIEFDRCHEHSHRDADYTDDGGDDSWGSGSELGADLLPPDDEQELRNARALAND